MRQRSIFPVVFGLGHSHCGSTLLGRMLDRHPQVRCTGELLWLDDALTNDLPCSCGARVPDCPYWSPRIRELPPALQSDYRETRIEDFDYLRRRDGKTLLLDLSKSRVYRHKRLWRNETAGYLHILRDPRALLASRLREGGELLHELRKHVKWQSRFERLARKMGHRAMTLHYEDLVTDPEVVLRHVCEFLGLDFDPVLLTPANGEHHFLHSSVSAYLKNSNILRADERWRHELTPEQTARIEQKTHGIKVYRERYAFGVTAPG